jgi:hypothetical protein
MNGRRVVLAVEDAQRIEEALGPAGGGVAMVAENLEAAADIRDQHLRVLISEQAVLRGRIRLGAGIELLFERGRGDDLQHSLRSEAIHGACPLNCLRRHPSERMLIVC